MLSEERKNIKENLKNKMMKSDIEGSVKIEKNRRVSTPSSHNQIVMAIWTVQKVKTMHT